MTRELKLALIVGFLLVLVVTILISDHLSKARSSKLASDLDPRSALVDAGAPITPAELAGGRATVPAPSEGSRVAGATTEAPAGSPTGPIGPAGVADPAGTVVAGAGQDPSTPDATRVADRGMTAPTSAPTPEPVVLVQGDGSQAGGTRPSLSKALDDFRNQLENGLPVGASTDGMGSQAATGNAAPQPTRDVPTGPATAGSVTRIPAPEAAQADRWHVVKDGETAFEITKKYYGDGNLWKKLQEANGDRIGKNGAVRIGVRIKLPPAEMITGKPDRSKIIPSDPTATPAKAEKPASTPRPAAAKVRTYTVLPGDTLIGIARKTLGSGKRADEIVDLNKGKLRDRNTVVVGMTLQLPEK